MTSEEKAYLDFGKSLVAGLVVILLFVFVALSADYLENGCATRPATCLVRK